ncbi:hypothetical protein B4Q04_09935 [Zobellia sp. OII3]|nr:hypothetical protein B4Q04_09935 [Zobellia sp. OII3]
MKTYLTGLRKAFKKVFNRCYLRVGMVCVPGLLVLAVNRLFFAKNLLLFWSGLKKAPERGLFGSVFWGNQWFVQRLLLWAVVVRLQKKFRKKHPFLLLT